MSPIFLLKVSLLLSIIFWLSTVTFTFAAQSEYDPPQPSSEFGTPEATARIAAKAGYLDVVGVKLGMTTKDALSEVKAHNAALALEPKARLDYEALPGVVIMPVLANTQDANKPSDPCTSVD